MDKNYYKAMCDTVRGMQDGICNPKQLAPITLAYIGDTVYDLFVRTYVIHTTDFTANKLHKKSVSLVCAKAQANAYRVIEPLLSDEELSIFKRGRNTHSNVPKSSSQADYRAATGLEALVGYLYLMKDDERLSFLMQTILESADTSSTDKKNIQTQG